jgi:hypothetical protein
VRGFRLLLLAVLAFTVAAATPRPVESTHLKIIVGVTDDTAKWMSRQDGIVGVHRDLRLMAARVTVPWKPGQVRPTTLQQVYLHRMARMIQLNDRIVLAVYNVARYALDGLASRSGRVRLRPRRRVPLEPANAPTLRHVRTQPIPGELCGAAVDPARGLGSDRRGGL